MKRAHEGTGNQFRGVNVAEKPSLNEDSNEEGIEAPIIDEPTFGCRLSDEEVQKLANNEDFQIYISEDEPSGSKHFILKPKPRKKKLSVSRKEFHDLKGKFDQILTVVSSTQQTTDSSVASLQHLEQRIMEI